ncbi:uncharacterized protein V1518DRAFT_458118 [Limtongia smithiae]|uniref:uncharacterized protein n=1 Tax=Limtongia smithiae TaxID=1125753 RepID=UPI0034CF0491
MWTAFATRERMCARSSASPGYHTSNPRSTASRDVLPRRARTHARTLDIYVDCSREKVLLIERALDEMQDMELGANGTQDAEPAHGSARHEERIRVAESAIKKATAEYGLRDASVRPHIDDALSRVGRSIPAHRCEPIPGVGSSLAVVASVTATVPIVATTQRAFASHYVARRARTDTPRVLDRVERGALRVRGGSAVVRRRRRTPSVSVGDPPLSRLPGTINESMRRGLSCALGQHGTGMRAANHASDWRAARPRDRAQRSSPAERAIAPEMHLYGGWAGVVWAGRAAGVTSHGRAGDHMGLTCRHVAGSDIRRGFSAQTRFGASLAAMYTLLHASCIGIIVAGARC